MASSDIIINHINYGGWPCIFYVFGSMGILWFPFWVFLAFDTPLLHPTITKDELILISQGMHHDIYNDDWCDDDVDGGDSNCDIDDIDDDVFVDVRGDRQ